MYALISFIARTSNTGEANTKIELIYKGLEYRSVKPVVIGWGKFK